MLYITLRGYWCGIIVLNVLAPTEDKSDDTNDSFYKEAEHVFNQFPNYHMKILLGDSNVNVGAEGIFILTIRNEILYEISNDNGVRIVNLATSKVYLLRVQCS
jgi:hypothetical protein